MKNILICLFIVIAITIVGAYPTQAQEDNSGCLFIGFFIDISGTMYYSDNENNKPIDSVVEAINWSLNEEAGLLSQGDGFAVYTFHGTGTLKSIVDTDFLHIDEINNFTNEISKLRSKKEGEERTDLVEPINKILEIAEIKKYKQYIFVIASDFIQDHVGGLENNNYITYFLQKSDLSYLSKLTSTNDYVRLVLLPVSTDSSKISDSQRQRGETIKKRLEDSRALIKETWRWNKENNFTHDIFKGLAKKAKIIESEVVPDNKIHLKISNPNCRQIKITEYSLKSDKYNINKQDFLKDPHSLNSEETKDIYLDYLAPPELIGKDHDIDIILKGTMMDSKETVVVPAFVLAYAHTHFTPYPDNSIMITQEISIMGDPGEILYQMNHSGNPLTNPKNQTIKTRGKSKIIISKIIKIPEDILENIDTFEKWKNKLEIVTKAGNTEKRMSGDEIDETLIYWGFYRLLNAITLLLIIPIIFILINIFIGNIKVRKIIDFDTIVRLINAMLFAIAMLISHYYGQSFDRISRYLHLPVNMTTILMTFIFVGITFSAVVVIFHNNILNSYNNCNIETKIFIIKYISQIGKVRISLLLALLTMILIWFVLSFSWKPMDSIMI